MHCPLRFSLMVATSWFIGCSSAPTSAALFEGSDSDPGTELEKTTVSSELESQTDSESESESESESQSQTDDYPLAQTLCPLPEARSGPIVIEGKNAPQLLGTQPSAWRALRLDGVVLRAQVLQIDERIVVDWPTPQTFYVVPEDNAFTLVSKDDDPSFDSNDELVLSPRSFGMRWPEQESAPYSPWVEVHATDPLTGAEGWVYLTTDEGAARAKVEDAQVRYFRQTCATDATGIGLDRCASKLARFLENTEVETACYALHFDKNYVMDEFIVSQEAGGAGVDVIDRWKGRAFTNGPELPFRGGPVSEHEDLVDEAKEHWGTAAFCGWSRTNGETHYYAGHKTGPVRVIRMVRGACSYANMVRTWVFSRSEVQEEIVMRGHGVPRKFGGIGFYWDYDSAAAPLEYRTSLFEDVRVMDGIPEPDGVNVRSISDEEMNDGYWEATSGPLGGIASFVQVLLWPKGAFEWNLYINDDASFQDGTGDEVGVWGGQGLRMSVLPPTNQDPAILSQRWRPWPAQYEGGAQALSQGVRTPVQVTVSVR